jgi:hypothetical protein
MSLFFKRDHPPGTPSVSVSWTSHGDPEELGRALDHHRVRMRAGPAGLELDPPTLDWLGVCNEVAMVRRETLFGRGLRPLPEDRRRRAEVALSELGKEARPGAPCLRAMLATALARDACTREASDEALAWSARAVEEEGAGTEAHILRASLLAAGADAYQAIPHLEAAVRLDGFTEEAHHMMCLLRQRLSGDPGEADAS